MVVVSGYLSSIIFLEGTIMEIVIYSVAEETGEYAADDANDNDHEKLVQGPENCSEPCNHEFATFAF